MPPVRRPRDLDWGDQPKDSAVPPRLGPGDAVSYFTRNSRFVYGVVLFPGSEPFIWPGNGPWEIPICGPDGEPVVLGRGLLVTDEGSHSEQDVLMPWGRWGEKGLVALNVGVSAGMPRWRFHPASRLVDLDLTCHAPQEDAHVTMAMSGRNVFVSRGQYPGVAVFARPPSFGRDYVYLTSLALPKWGPVSSQVAASFRLTPRALKVFEAPPAEQGGDRRELLAVGVAATHRAHLQGEDWVPRVVLYDVTQLAAPAVDCQGLSAPVATPGLNQPGDPLRCGQDRVRAVLFRPLPPGSTEEHAVSSLDHGKLPDTTLADTGEDRDVLLVATPATVELLDLTSVLGYPRRQAPGGDSIVGNSSSLLEAALRARLTRVPGRVPIETRAMAGLGISDGPVGSCGAPAENQAPADYANLDYRAEWGKGLCMAGRYATVGWATRAPPSNALSLLAFSYELDDASDLRMRVIGLAAPQVGVPAAPDEVAVRQFETWSNFHFIEVSAEVEFPEGSQELRGRLRDGRWVLGCARSSFGMVGFKLPAEADATTIVDYIANEGFWPESGLPCSGTEVYPTSRYPGAAAGALPEQVEIECLALGACGPGQLPSNLLPGVVFAGAPDDPGHLGLGFGQEFVNGVVVEHPDGDVLLLADRGSLAIWAFAAEPRVGRVLDAGGLIANLRGVTTSRFDQSNEFVVGVGSNGPALHILRWHRLGGTQPNGHLHGMLAVVPNWNPVVGSPPTDLLDFPRGYTDTTTLRLSGDLDVVVAGVTPYGAVSAGTGYDVVLMHVPPALGTFATSFSGGTTLLHELQNSPQRVVINEGHRRLGLRERVALTDDWVRANAAVDLTTTFFRFGRACDASGAVLSTVLQTSRRGPISIPGLVQAIAFVHLSDDDLAANALLGPPMRPRQDWLAFLVQRIEPDASTLTATPEYHFVIARVLDSPPPGGGLGSGCPGGGGDVVQGNDWRAGAGTVGLEIAEAIPLGSPGKSTELPKLVASPDGYYFMAMGEGEAGCWLIEVDYSEADPRAVVVEGLRKAGSSIWYGWDSTAATATTATSRRLSSRTSGRAKPGRRLRPWVRPCRPPRSSSPTESCSC